MLSLHGPPVQESCFDCVLPEGKKNLSTMIDYSYRIDLIDTLDMQYCPIALLPSGFFVQQAAQDAGYS